MQVLFAVYAAQLDARFLECKDLRFHFGLDVFAFKFLKHNKVCKTQHSQQWPQKALSLGVWQPKHASRVS